MPTQAYSGHLSALGALILLLIAWQYRLDSYQLLYSHRGAVFGAGYTDVNAQLPAYNILIVVTIIAALLLLANVFLRRTWRIMAGVLVVWFGISLSGGQLLSGSGATIPSGAKRVYLDHEYIDHNIDLTRAAYELDSVEVVNYRAVEEISSEALQAEPATIQHSPVGLSPAAAHL